jgi:hypothetical protein
MFSKSFTNFSVFVREGLLVGRIDMEYGFVEFAGNEQTIASTIDDPPKVRLAAPRFGRSVTVGGLTFSRLRSDGKQEELVIIQGKQDERVRGTDIFSGRIYNHHFSW